MSQTNRVWLCIEAMADGAYRVHGDTGRGGWMEPFLPRLCQFGGPNNHRKDCGWYTVRESSPPKVWRSV